MCKLSKKISVLVSLLVSLRFLFYSKNVPDYSASREKKDLGFLTFDLKTDLTDLFNWNVKQLFLYLTAEYQTPNNVLNQVIFGKIFMVVQNNQLKDHFFQTDNFAFLGCALG